LAATFCFLAILLLSGTSASGKAALAAGPVSEVNFAPVQAAIEKSGGLLTPDVRSAYLDWAEMSVLQSLSNAGQSVPADCIAEVQADPTLRDAMFGAIDPPDPSILQNYAALRAALGAPFVAKYQALVIADAVTERVKGIRLAPTPAPSATPAMVPAPDPLVAGISAYIKLTGTTTLQLFQDPQAQQKLAAFLQTRNVDATLIGEIGRTDKFHSVLRRVLVALGERPDHRDPSPDAAEWLHYLVSIYESKPANQSGNPPEWPRFPMATAPWPLLMPLAHVYPLSEAGYIWETYEGYHGSTRMHTYGPYEEPVTEWPRELRPSQWYWSAWPDVIVHGGECTTMAPMAVQNEVALGVPAVMAGQPGHCNLMVFHHAGNFWYTSVDQAFAGGPDVTYGSWLFKEIGTAPGFGEQNNAAWASADYHIGLAQSMNAGLRPYIDTRIAVNLYHHLPAAELPTLGASLLGQAIQTDPFNPAPWYLLGKQTKSIDEGIALVQKAMQVKAMEDSKTAGSLADSGNAATEISWPDASPANSSAPKPVVNSRHAYWHVVEEYLTRRTVLNHPTPTDKAAAEKVYAFLQTVPGISAAREASYVVATNDPGQEAQKLVDMIEEHVAGNKRSSGKAAAAEFGAELKAYLTQVSKDESVAFLAQLQPLLPQLPPDDPYLVIVQKAEKKLNASHS
jgi:hypothetical protein